MRFPNLFPFSKKKQDEKSDLEYARYSSRSFALAFDVMLLFFILTPIFEWLSQQFVPQFYLTGGVTQVQQIMSALGNQEVSVEMAVEQFERIGFFSKMIFDYSVQFFVCGALFVFFWNRYDCSPGMMVLRMYIARSSDGEKPSVQQYILRYVVGVGQFYWLLALSFSGILFNNYVMLALATAPLLFNLCSMVLQKQRRAIHDFASGTVMLKCRFRFGKKAAPVDDKEDSGQ